MAYHYSVHIIICDMAYHYSAHTFCMRTHAHARANDAEIVRSRDAQCNTKELP